jgi:hypothetical protein
LFPFGSKLKDICNFLKEITVFSRIFVQKFAIWSREKRFAIWGREIFNEKVQNLKANLININ